MVQEAIKETGRRHGVVTRVSVQLGLGSETLRGWVRQAEIDNGQRPGIRTQDQQRIAELEKENRELRIGYSYFVFGAGSADTLAPVVAALAGH